MSKEVHLVNVQMSAGEQLVWAAAFALELNAIPAETSRLNRQAMTREAARRAWHAVVALREIDPITLPREADMMWLAMIGMNRAADGTLYP